ncbi:MAG TPA: hypothetical protein PKZ12_02760 [Smithellaceae bacterium]|nr:hypothetical protein [Smithellaceae bacterium]
MMAKLTAKCILIIIIAFLVGCGGLRFSQVSPEAKDFHPKRIAVFPADVGSYEEARGIVEKVVAGVIAEKKWFADIMDVESLNRQLAANEELRKAMETYLSKLKTVNFSDDVLSKKIGQLAKVDAFLLIGVDYWNYAVENDRKVGKAGLSFKFIEAASGKIMWKAGHQRADSYRLIKPDLPDVAKDVVKEMIEEMPH